MGKQHDSEIVTRSAPKWAWDIIDEILASDSESSASELRESIKKAYGAMVETSESMIESMNEPMDED